MPYIGKTTDGFGVRNRFVYLASSGDTSVSGADANGATLTFTDGAYVDVYLNGVLLKPTTDYNTSTANTIAGLSALNTNDEVTVVVYDVFTVADMVSATSGGTFSGAVKVDDTTDSTSTTTGSIQTDGGVGIAKDLVVGDDILLKSDAGAIQFGADSEITLTHSSDNGLLIKHAASGDDKFPSLVLQTGDTDIAVNDVLGRIDFQAPDEGTGTDAVLRAASIRAISEGDFSASNNATTLEFMTGATATPTRRMRISSTGETTITRAGSVTDHGGLLRLNGTYSSNNDGPNIMFHGTATDQYPSMQILNYSHDDQSINFDAYYNTSGTWTSSDAGSNISIYKRSDTLSFAMEDGITAGSAITWKDHYKMTVSGGGTHTWYNTASSSGVMSLTGNTEYAYCRRSWLAWTDNNYDLGHASNRWDDIFATNSTINTSDENQKKDIADSDLGTDFIKALKPKKFKFKDGTRQHYGLIAQDVEKLLSDSSIDTKDFAGFIKTPTYKPKTVDVLDREDKKIGEYEEIGEETNENFKEYRYGLRLNEFIAPMIKMLQEQQEKIETLEAKVKTLEEA